MPPPKKRRRDEADDTAGQTGGAASAADRAGAEGGRRKKAKGGRRKKAKPSGVEANDWLLHSGETPDKKIPFKEYRIYKTPRDGKQDVTDQYPALKAKRDELVTKQCRLSHKSDIGTGKNKMVCCTTCQGLFLVHSAEHHFRAKCHTTQIDKLREGWHEGELKLVPVQVIQPSNSFDTVRLEPPSVLSGRGGGYSINLLPPLGVRAMGQVEPEDIVNTQGTHKGKCTWKEVICESTVTDVICESTVTNTSPFRVIMHCRHIDHRDISSRVDHFNNHCTDTRQVGGNTRKKTPNDGKDLTEPSRKIPVPLPR
eukprot:COSAG01_NODE_20099_length_970_cov_1.676234_1_plen_310_part_10